MLDLEQWESKSFCCLYFLFKILFIGEVGWGEAETHTQGTSIHYFTA